MNVICYQRLIIGHNNITCKIKFGDVDLAENVQFQISIVRNKIKHHAFFSGMYKPKLNQFYIDVSF